MFKKFNRCQEPKTSMGIGIVEKVENWLNEKGTTDTGYIIGINEEEKIVVIKVDGDVVFEDFEIINAEGIKGAYRVEFEFVTGYKTILNQLTDIEIYSRIKKFYEMILKECFGKTHQEQEDYLNKLKSRNKSNLKSGVIENSEKYIRNLSNKPTQGQMKDLVKQISLGGILEYAYYAKDEYSVEMNQYSAMLDKNLPFSEYLGELKNLFHSLTVDKKKIESLREIFLRTDYYFEKNAERFTKKQSKPIRSFSEKPVIKYLLICEAPPSSGKYFYKSTDDYLFKQVWNIFFQNKICSKQNEAYQCLADMGFLLVDTLPYAMKYQSRHRNRNTYHALIKACLPWWINKLNSNFTFATDLKIAFGFKLNAQSLMKATGGKVCLGAKDHPLTPNMIAASGAGQPTTANLVRIFQIASKQICHRCP